MKYENQFLNYNALTLSGVNRSNMTTQDFSMPNIPQQSVVVRGSALSNVNRSNIVMDSRSSMGEVAQLDPLIKQRAELEGKISTIDEQLIQLNQLLDDTQSTQITQKGIYDELKAKIEASDRASSLNPRKMTASQRIIAVQNMDRAWSAYQTASASLKTYSDQISSLLAQRKVYADQLFALGRPVPRIPISIKRKDLANRIESMQGSPLNKIADNVNDAIKNTFSGGFGGGGFGGGGSADMGEDAGTAQSFFGKNKLAILALGGVVGYLLLKR